MRVTFEDEPGWGMLPPLAGPSARLDAAPLIQAASAAVRRHVGWHIAPVLEDTLTMQVPAGHIGTVALPTGKLRRVIAVRVNGAQVTGWTHLTASLLRIPLTVADPSVIEVDVHHGYTLEEVPDLWHVVEQMAAIAASSPSGAVREQAGALAVTYAQTTSGVGGGLAILERDAQLLEPYRIDLEP